MRWMRMEFSGEEACDLNTSQKGKSNQKTNKDVQAAWMLLLLNSELLKRPDY